MMHPGVWALPAFPVRELTPDELNQRRAEVMRQFPYTGCGLLLQDILNSEDRAVQSLVAEGFIKEHPFAWEFGNYRVYYRPVSPAFWTVLRAVGHTFNFSMLASWLIALDLWTPWRWALAWVGIVPLLLNVLAMTATIALGVALMKIPELKWGWMSIFTQKGTAENATVATAGVPGIVGTSYTLLLLVALPALAQMEEELFREGTISVGDAVSRSILFGLVHAFVGIPLGGAIALTVTGLYFSAWYYVGGVEASTGAHAAWNVLCVLVMMACRSAPWILSKVKAQQQKRVNVLDAAPEQRAAEAE